MCLREASASVNCRSDRGYRVIHTRQSGLYAEEVAQADLVVTSVIPTNLPAVAPLLAEGLKLRSAKRPGAVVNVIAAENMEHGSSVLRGLVQEALGGASPQWLDAVARFPDSMIARVVPIPEDPLLVKAEEFSEWTVDGRVYFGEDPQIKTLELVPNQEARLRRKLFIHNTGHATCAYAALRKGYRYVHQGARDPKIHAEVRAAIQESGAAVAAEHGFDSESIAAYQENLLSRLPGDAFLDGLDRVCRQPIRKLGPHERFIGPINLCLKHGLDMDHLGRAVAVVLHSDLPGDEEYGRLKTVLGQGGVEKVLQEICQLAPSHPACSLIIHHYENLGSAP